MRNAPPPYLTICQPLLLPHACVLTQHSLPFHIPSSSVPFFLLEEIIRKGKGTVKAEMGTSLPNWFLKWPLHLVSWWVNHGLNLGAVTYSLQARMWHWYWFQFPVLISTSNLCLNKISCSFFIYGNYSSSIFPSLTEITEDTTRISTVIRRERNNGGWTTKDEDFRNNSNY